MRNRNLVLPIALQLAMGSPVVLAQDGGGMRSAATEAEESGGLEALREAVRKGDLREVVRLAGPCLAATSDPLVRAEVAMHEARALLNLEEWARCIEACERIRKEAARCDPPRGGIDQNLRAESWIRGFALLAAGRKEEARKCLDEGRATYPDLDRDATFRNARMLAGMDIRFKIDADYAGRYKGDLRMIAGMNAVIATLSGATNRVRERLGLEDLASHPILIDFRDARDMVVDGDVPLMAARPFRMGDASATFLSATAEALVTGYMDVEACLSHEIIHAIQQSWSPDSRPPDWVIEGLAHWASGEGFEVFETELLLGPETPFLPRGRRPMPGLGLRSAGDPSRSTAFYSKKAGAFAFRAWEGKRGMERVRRFALDVLRGRNLEIAFEERMGVSLERGQEEAEEEYAAWRTATLEPVARFAGALDPWRMASRKRVMAEIRKARESMEEGLRSSTLDWLLACMASAEDPAEAVRLLEQAERACQGNGPFLRECMFRRMTILAGSGKKEEAASLGREFLRDWLWSAPGWKESVERIVAMGAGGK